jgi:acyl-coenzyme A thioesterase PaaI-like protein
MMMGSMLELNGENLMRLWRLATKVPGGRAAFSKLPARMAPYTATIGAVVEHVEPGYARLSMKDRPGVRNHLKSVHAIALANFVEETTGLAMMSALPPGMRGIVKHIEITYVKKGRGTLTGECHAPPIEGGVESECKVTGTIRNAAGELVAHGTATWLLRPAR